MFQRLGLTFTWHDVASIGQTNYSSKEERNACFNSERTMIVGEKVMTDAMKKEFEGRKLKKLNVSVWVHKIRSCFNSMFPSSILTFSRVPGSYILFDSVQPTLLQFPKVLNTSKPVL